MDGGLSTPTSVVDFRDVPHTVKLPIPSYTITIVCYRTHNDNIECIIHNNYCVLQKRAFSVKEYVVLRSSLDVSVP